MCRFLIWDETMPPAALTIWGNLEDGFGLMNGDELKMFIYDNSTGLNYLVENTWNNQVTLLMERLDILIMHYISL